MATFFQSRNPGQVQVSRNQYLSGISAFSLLATVAAAITLTVTPAMAQGIADADADGVADSHDVCPRTPRGVAATFRGCAPFEVASAADELLRRSHADLDRAVEAVGDTSVLAPLARKANRVLRLHRRGLAVLRAGNPCGAELEQERFAQQLTAFRDKIGRKIGAAARRNARTAPAGKGDVAETDLPISRARIAQSMFENASDALLEDLRSVAAVCDAVVAPLIARGRITDIDDATRRLELDTGLVVLMPEKKTRRFLSEGMIVAIAGLDFGSNTGIANDLIPEGVSAQPVNVALECMHFRMVPIQLFPPHSAGPFLTHHPLAYQVGEDEQDPWLWIDRGMRMAVSDSGCPGREPDENGNFVRYSAKIESQYLSETESVKDKTLAADLQSSDDPLPFPADLDFTAGQVLLTVTVRKQNCSILIIPGLPNCAPVEEIRVEHYGMDVKPPGAICESVYSQKEFSLDENDAGAFGDAAVNETSYVLSYPSGDDPTDLWFEAEGYGWNDGTSSYPVVQPIHVGNAFAIHQVAQDFYQDDEAWPFEKTGVHRPSGLRFPRLHGKRAGRSFAYTCAPPSITRDVLAWCADPSPNTYYRLPFEGGDADTWELGQANNGASSHTSSGPQRYAYDFGAAPGTPVLAARSGLVVHVEDTNIDSCYDDVLEECVDCENPYDANLVAVLHQDGSVARYYHAPENGAVVSEGDHVVRGDRVNIVGSTGCSTGPHLHFDVLEPGEAEETMPVRFESAVPGHATCYNPDEWEPLDSTNVEN